MSYSATWSVDFTIYLCCNTSDICYCYILWILLVLPSHPLVTLTTGSSASLLESTHQREFKTVLCKKGRWLATGSLLTLLLLQVSLLPCTLSSDLAYHLWTIESLNTAGETKGWLHLCHSLVACGYWASGHLYRGCCISQKDGQHLHLVGGGQIFTQYLQEQHCCNKHHCYELL